MTERPYWARSWEAIMAEKIGPQHGLEARRLQENELHPGIPAWDRSAETFKALVDGHNETIQELIWIHNEYLNLKAIVQNLGGVFPE